MSSVTDDSTTSRRRILAALLVSLVCAAATLGACAFDGTKKAKENLSRFGSIEAEWQIRDDAEEKTYTYVMLSTKANTHETYEIIAQDGRRETTRELVGGIDGTGCYLTPYGVTTRWIDALPTDALKDARKSGDKTRTACLEYKEKAAWQFVPAKDKKAAEPPPPPPKKPSPDAGSPDGGDAPDGGTPEKGADKEGEDDEGSSMEGTLPL